MNPDATVDAAAYDKLQTSLTAKGVRSADITKAIGTPADAKTAKEVEAKLTAWLATLPKGK